MATKKVASLLWPIHNLLCCASITVTTKLKIHNYIKQVLRYYHVLLHMYCFLHFICTFSSSFPSRLLLSAMTKPLIREDTKSNLLSESALFLSNPSPHEPPIWILLTSLITPDAPEFITPKTAICVRKPVGKHNHHFYNIHNRGLLQIFPQVWQCIYSADRLWEQMAK